MLSIVRLRSTRPSGKLFQYVATPFVTVIAWPSAPEAGTVSVVMTRSARKSATLIVAAAVRPLLVSSTSCRAPPLSAMAER